MPCILKRLYLAVCRCSGGRFEQYVVIGVRIERRVEIDKVNAFTCDLVAQYVKVIAIIEPVGHGYVLDGLWPIGYRNFGRVMTVNLPAVGLELVS